MNDLNAVLVEYLYPVDKNPVRTRKIDNNFARILDFKDIKFPLKIRDICEIEKSKLYQHQCFWLWEQKKNPGLRFKNYF